MSEDRFFDLSVPHEWKGFNKTDIDSCRTRAKRETFRFESEDEWVIGQRMDWRENPWPVGMSSKLFNWFHRRHALLAKTPEEKQAVVDEFIEVRTEQLFLTKIDLSPWFTCTNCERDNLLEIASLFPPKEIEKALRGRFLAKEMPEWVRNWFPKLERNPKSNEAANWVGGWYLEHAVYHPGQNDHIGAMAKMLGYWLTMHLYWSHPKGFYDFSNINKHSFAETRIAGDEPCPTELAEFIQTWMDKANEMFKKWSRPMYYIKGAGIRFRYKGRDYKLGTAGFGDGSDEFFEHIAWDLEFALSDFGAEAIYYDGMID